jgi:hypothetical protein
MLFNGETHTLLKEWVMHTHSLFLPYLQLCDGGDDAHLIGRSGDSGQRKVESLENEQ